MIKLILLSLGSIILTACSSGSSSGSGPLPSPGYIRASESSIDLAVGESAVISLSLFDAASIPSTLPLTTIPEGVVTLNPNSCTFDNSVPPTCSFIVEGVESGTTIITQSVLPGQPVAVTVN